MGRVSLRQYEPLYNAAQLLSQANTSLTRNWDPSQEINFNDIVDKQNTYEQRERIADYQSELANQMPDAATPEDVARIRMEAAQQFGMADDFEKAQQEYEEEQLRGREKEIFSSNEDMAKAVDELQKEYLKSGHIEKALSLKPKEEFHDIKLGNQILRRNAAGEWTPIFTGQGSGGGDEDNSGKYEYYYSQDDDKNIPVKIGSKDYYEAIANGQSPTNLTSLLKLQKENKERLDAEHAAKKSRTFADYLGLTTPNPSPAPTPGPSKPSKLTPQEQAELEMLRAKHGRKPRT